MVDWRRWSWTLGALGASACEGGSSEAPVPDPKPGPPTIVDVAKTDATVFELYFSEPVAPVDAVDPSAFRLSFGIVYGSGADASTRYEGPMGFLCSSTDFCTDEAEVVSIETGPNEAIVRIRVAAWAPIFCEQLSYLQSWTSAELLLHHRGGDATIVDSDADALAPFGETWVDHDADYYLRVDGDLPQMALPIPCPT